MRFNISDFFNLSHPTSNEITQVGKKLIYKMKLEYKEEKECVHTDTDSR